MIEAAAEEAAEPSSFRDPSGFVFARGRVLYRRVNRVYRHDYDALMGSGLYEALTDEGLLIPHEEVERRDVAPEDAAAAESDAYVILKPETVPFVSYPYEWSFSQLRDAALATLSVQKAALGRGMWLKDASAYNIQFRRGRPVLIDTLSFERYRQGEPWVAYRQFCQHFLAPLALMSRVDVRLGQLTRVHIDGVPLDLASRLLPWSARAHPLLLPHVFLHALAQRRYADRPRPVTRRRPGAGMTKTALRGLIDSLESAVRHLRWRPHGTEWGDYYNHTSYSAGAMETKERLVAEMLDAVAPAPRNVWDLGANTGRFSRIAGGRGIPTIAWDIDPAAVEKNYLQCRRENDAHLLPLCQDLTNPSPDLGWAQRERRSLSERGPADLLLALALVHHLAIGNQVPLEQIARFFRRIGHWLIAEFVPADDPQALRLLRGRESVFRDYHRAAFEESFRRHFTIERAAPIPTRRASCT
jgi:ribosomal protein L11 methylase PrmA